MSECNHDCSSCSENCGERKEANVFEKKPLHEGCRVGKHLHGTWIKAFVLLQVILP